MAPFDSVTEAMEREVFDRIERDMPALWRVCYPRIYREPKCGRYYSAKKPARQLTIIGMKILQNLVAPSEIYEFHLASHLARFRVPMYWLSDSIAEALQKTTPPGAIDWYHMPMPFDAAVFMLPKGSLVHPTDGDVSFVCYARMPAGANFESKLVPGKPYCTLNGGMVLAAAVESGYFIHWNIPLDKYGPRVTMEELSGLMRQFSGNEHATAIQLRDGGMKPADFELGPTVAHFIFSTILLMTARPDLVTTGKLTNKTPTKKGREPKEFWSPNVIGEHYKLRREHGPSQGGTHSSPRFHWVQGFWREQPHGPALALRRSQWIEPYTRGIGK